MSSRKRKTCPPAQLVTIPEFLKANPIFTDNQVRWAVRNRRSNGLAPFTFRQRTGKRKLLIDSDLYAAHLYTPVPA